MHSVLPLPQALLKPLLQATRMDFYLGVGQPFNCKPILPNFRKKLISNSINFLKPKRAN